MYTISKETHFSTNTSEKTFHRPIHLYRAFTIILIVAAHSWALPILYYSTDFSVDPKLNLLSSITETLFHGSTIIFALISGLLFSLILKNKGWHSFYTSKIKNVLLPYLVMTYIYTFIQWKITFVGFYEVNPDTLIGYITTTISNIPLGLASFHLWYMPILFLLFLTTPIISYLTNQKNNCIIAVVIAAPLLASRVWPEFSWLTVIYFLGAYTVGILVGSNDKRSLELIQQHKVLILLTFFITSALLVCFYLIGVEKFHFISIRESLFYIQKLALAGLLLNLVYYIEKRVPTWMDTIGNYSFAIYFIHPILAILFVLYLKEQNLLSNNPWYILMIGAIILIYSLTVSILLSWFIKQIAGKYSRIIIGA